MSPRILITSDLHLELAAWRDHPAMWGDSYYALQQIVDIAIDHDVLAVALLGDVFNVKLPDAYTVHVACKQIQRLQDAGIKVFFLQGQHELSRMMAWLQVHTWPKHIHRVRTTVGGICFYGLDWLPQGRITEELKQVPHAADVLFTHQVWREMWNSKIVPGECTFTDVPAHVRVLVSGDYHKHFTKTYDNNGGKMLVGSPGATCLQAINEEPQKAVFILNDDLGLTSVPLRSRAVYEANIESLQQLEHMLKQAESVATLQEGVPPHIGINILRVTFDETIPDIYNRIVKAYRGKVHLFLNPKKPEKVEVTIANEARRACVAGGLVAALDLCAPAGSPVNRDVRRLLAASPDLATELSVMKTEFVAQYKEQKRGDSKPKAV